MNHALAQVIADEIDDILEGDVVEEGFGTSTRTFKDTLKIAMYF